MNYIPVSKFAHFLKYLDQLLSAISKSKTEEDTPITIKKLPFVELP